MVSGEERSQRDYADEEFNPLEYQFLFSLFSERTGPLRSNKRVGPRSRS
jgi:hypothetical protein